MADPFSQIHLDYAPDEDRLLLRMSTLGGTGYRLWLTRPFVKKLWTVLVAALEAQPDVKGLPQPQAKRAVMAFEKEKVMQTSKASKGFQDQKLNMVHGDSPLLLTQIDHRFLENNLLHLTMKDRQGRLVAFHLDKKLLYILCDLMIQVTAKTDWDLNLAIGEAGMVAGTSGEKAVMH